MRTHNRKLSLVGLTVAVLLVLSGCELAGLLGMGEPAITQELSGTISEDMTLEADSGYAVTDDVTVNAALTIEEGVVLEFASDTRLYIRDGSIEAVGTESNPIVFRGETAVSGFWKGVQVNSTDVTNTLEYVEISHTGSTELDGDKTAIMVEGFSRGALNVVNVSVSDAEGYGLVVQSGGSLRSFSSNVFQNIDGVPVKVDATQTAALDTASIFRETNTTNIVEVSGTSLDVDSTWVALNGGVPYRVMDNLVVDATLTISPGVTVEFDSAGILIIDDTTGGIIAEGTASERIVFTGAEQVAGYWRGIEIQSNAATNAMDYVTVSYAGHPSGLGGDVAAIQLDGFHSGQLTLTNSEISNSDSDGVVVESGASLTESGNTYVAISGDNIVYE